MSIIALARLRAWQYPGPPTSGLNGTYAKEAEAGSYLWDTTNNAMFVNEGTLLSPYWTPIGYDQAPLFGAHSDWRDGVGVAVAGADADVIIAGSGVRVFGQGGAENDSGAVTQTATEGGKVMRLTTTDEDLHTICLGLEAGVMQPDQHKLLVIDVELTMVTDILNNSIFIGFLGTAADVLVVPATGATTVATLVQDDMAGLFMSTGFTDADAFYGVHNKSNAAATMPAGVLDPLTNLAAAGTFQRFRVEIAADGDMTCFIDKVEVYSEAIALDVDEECSPVMLLESNAMAIKTMDVKRIAMYAYR